MKSNHFGYNIRLAGFLNGRTIIIIISIIITPHAIHITVEFEVTVLVPTIKKTMK